VKDWEIIADNLSKAGWSWGCVSALDSAGRTIWITDAHRDDGQRFVVRIRCDGGCLAPQTVVLKKVPAASYEEYPMGRFTNAIRASRSQIGNY